MKVLTRVGFVVLALMLVVLLVPVGCGDKEATAEGGTLRIGINSDPNYPGDPTDYLRNSIIMRKPAIESLAREDETGKLQPWLAEGWEIDAVAKTITVELRQGIKFQDGTDFNAEAVKFNWELWQAAEAAETANVSSIDVIDEYTIRANLSQWDSIIEFKLLYWAGQMVSPTSWETNGEDWASSHPVGTGPFEFVSWVRGSSLTYQKFDGYWQEGKPYLDSIEFVIISDETTMEMSFLSGEIDLIVDATPLQGHDLEAEIAAGTYNSASLAGGGSDVTFLLFNGDPDSPFADVRVRQAVMYAIDRQSVVNDLLYDAAAVADQWAAPGHWAYNSDVAAFTYDLDKARDLLAEADKADGFTTTILSYAGVTDKQAEALQGMFAEIGITLEINSISGLGMWDYIATGWPEDGILLQGLPSDEILYRMVWATSTSPIFVSLPHTADIDDMYAQAIAAPDFETKQACTQALQQLIFEEYTTMGPLWIEYSVCLSYPTVHDAGFDVTDSVQWTPEDCWIEE
jgi:ABC-type transport system substrate-binding protein